MRRLRVLTWHIHGNYLWYLSQADVDFFLPVRASGDALGCGGRGGTFPFGDNVHDVPAEEVRKCEFDLVLYQHYENYVHERWRILSEAQRSLPSIYLEHDPPMEHPTGQRHRADEPNLLLVHVTPFNQLMWNCGNTPTKVVEHGVLPPPTRYTGELPRGIVVINHLFGRGRRLGLDVFDQLRERVPLDLVGMGAEEIGGIGEIPPTELGQFISRYRFFFNPIRYTSLGLAVCEAMTMGMPIVGLATTEMATAIQNGRTGYVDTNLDVLVEHMQTLLGDATLARRLGENARDYALKRFDIARFAHDWEQTFHEVVSSRREQAGTASLAASI
jgi:hypothetical protein